MATTLLEKETEIIFNREAMIAALTVVGGAVNPKCVKEILQMVKLVADPDGGTELLGSDTEVSIRHRVLGVKVDGPTEVVISPTQLARILKHASDDSVMMLVAEDGVTVRGAKWKYKLPTSDPTAFPNVHGFETLDFHVCSAADLRKLIRRSSFATDPESTRYALGGALLEAESDSLTMVGTDGRRLARQEVAAEQEGKGIATGGNTVVIPLKALKLIDKCLGDDDPPIHIATLCSPGPNNQAPHAVLIRTDQAVISTQLVQGRFPRYQDVFPQAFKTVVTVTVGELLDACEQVVIMTSEESRGVDFVFEKDSLRMACQAADVGSGDREIEISTVSGEPVEASLDVRYLIEALKPLAKDAVLKWELIDAKNALVFKTEDRYSHVIMPLTRDR